jgi:hypothetical protein
MKPPQFAANARNQGDIVRVFESLPGFWPILINLGQGVFLKVCTREPYCSLISASMCSALWLSRISSLELAKQTPSYRSR